MKLEEFYLPILHLKITFFLPDLRQNRLTDLATLKTFILPSKVNTKKTQKCLEIFQKSFQIRTKNPKKANK